MLMSGVQLEDRDSKTGICLEEHACDARELLTLATNRLWRGIRKWPVITFQGTTSLRRQEKEQEPEGETEYGTV